MGLLLILTLFTNPDTNTIKFLNYFVNFGKVFRCGKMI